MHLHTYRGRKAAPDTSTLIGGRGHPWSIDLVTVTSSGILVMGFHHRHRGILDLRPHRVKLPP